MPSIDIWDSIIFLLLATAFISTRMSYIPALRDAERISIENKCKPPLLVENRLIGIITYFVVAIIISPALLIIILGPSAWLMTFDTAILASILEKDEKK